MSENNKSYRIKANINNDTVLNVNLNQDFDILEVLSLKIRRENLYKAHTSNYGCVVGRVLGNGNFGIPNAKISIFVSASTQTIMDSVMSDLYPYSSINDQDGEGRRYNLLPDEKVSECHSSVGSFPNKRLVLDDDNVLEIFENYYKYTTRSNESGDYMIFGVPVGSHILHTDIDLSDIGILSQKPHDLLAQGYNITQFDNANKFKESPNLDNLAQILTQNNAINVEPFWGDEETGEISLSRQDINIQYKFEPTCVFMGSMVSDEKSNGVSKECIATDKMGEMRYLTAGNGTIEMIRKTSDGDVEEVRIEGTQLIDGNGTWCYQIPMNLDYMRTDEYGNMVPTDDPTKGIPTRARVRFRFSLSDFDSDYSNSHLAKVLVPNNPHSYEDLDYAFGTNTKDDDFATKSFRDLFWNNVYSVKSYIPRIQNGDGNTKNFTGIKRVNVHEGNNPIPYNNIRIHLSFSYILQCAILKILIKTIGFINILIGIMNTSSSSKKACVALGDGICPDLEDWYFAPNCDYLSATLSNIQSAKDTTTDNTSIDSQNMDNNTYCITKKIDYLMQCIEIRLAMETDTIEFDFFNDWINGLLYIPRWFVKIRKKKSLLFGLIHIKGSVKSCMENTFSKERRLVQQCGLEYTMDGNRQFSKVVSNVGCRKSDNKLKCHKGSGRKSASIFKRKHKNGGGIVHTEPTIKQQSVYYFKPSEWILDNGREVRANLFATDIILLGSLKDCDANGIPQAFKYLSSSSFKIPTNLALTNMQNDGYMYGRKGGGVYCTGEVEGIEEPKNSFKRYKEWANGTEFAYNVDYDVDDYAVTEASGIDWGYSGPNQGKNDNKLYNPGGHFLGIACFAAQTNIKSCVNLSRVCEIGADLSQRQAFVVRTGENNYAYSYLIPTGVITKNDLSESDFRRMFATLNYNNLKTVKDEETQTLKYEIIPLSMNNFGGELSGHLSNEKYNQLEPLSDDNEETVKTSTTSAYTFTEDIKSVDYYNFRLGLHDNERAEDRYLKSYNGVVSMPVYENSYYFYFGLKDGSTAFDRFLTNYYAPCGDDSGLYPSVEVKITNAQGSYDESNVLTIKKNGSVSIVVQNVIAPFTVTLSRKDNESLGDDVEINGESFSGTCTMDYNEFVISELTHGEYTLTVGNEEIASQNVDFTISVVPTQFIQNIEIISVDFTRSKQYDNEITDNNGGFRIIGIDDPNISIVITDFNYYTVINKTTPIMLSGLTEIEYPNLSGSDDMVYVWAGNNDYTIYVSEDGHLSKIGNYLIQMPSAFDYYIGNKAITGSRLDEYIFIYDSEKNVYGVNENWADDILKDMNAPFTKNEKTILSNVTSFKSEKDNSLNVGCVGGTLPYEIIVYGNGEKGNELHQFASTEQSYEDGYQLDINSFKIPTSTDLNASKGPYMLTFRDAQRTTDSNTYDYSSMHLNDREIKYYISIDISEETHDEYIYATNETDSDLKYTVTDGYNINFNIDKVEIDRVETTGYTEDVYISFEGELLTSNDVLYSNVYASNQRINSTITFYNTTSKPTQLKLKSDIRLVKVGTFTRQDKFSVVVESQNITIVNGDFKTTATLPYAELNENIKYIPIHCK